MENTITVDDLAENLADVLDRIHDRGERFIIERNGELVATLAPPIPRSSVTLREIADQLADLSLPGDGFADDLEAIQSSQPKSGLPPWRD
jgi:antitoxin (DNA-binding transcriptional repressor) of toxin-antitoxin stability system